MKGQISEKMAEVDRVSQVTNNRFLNYYELNTTKKYYMCSRRESAEKLDLMTGADRPDGVVMFALYGEDRDRVVLVHQYRYPLGAYIYELPAGLVEDGEQVDEAALREMREETGLEFHPVLSDSGYERPFYSSAGMTDESCCMVFGTAGGTISQSGLEDTEQLDVVLADRQEAARILREENVAANCAFMLMNFISSPLMIRSGLAFGWRRKRLREMSSRFWAILVLEKPYLQRGLQQALAYRKTSVVRHLRSSSFMRRDGCRCIILMYIESVTRRK